MEFIHIHYSRKISQETFEHTEQGISPILSKATEAFPVEGSTTPAHFPSAFPMAVLIRTLGSAVQPIRLYSA